MFYFIRAKMSRRKRRKERNKEKWSALRANCKWVYQELDSRFRGNDVALQRFAVMPVQAGIQDLLLLRVNATEIRSSGAAGSAAHAQASGLCH